MKTSAKIILLIFFMTVIVYKNVHSQNVYNDRLNYYNMDTTGCVSYGRWDPPDSILQARKEGRRFIYLPSEYVTPTYKRGDPLYTVSRGTIKLRELKIINHKISRTIKKAIKNYRITPKLYDSDTSSNLSSEEKAKYIILPDSSGYFVSIDIGLYNDLNFIFRIRVMPNYFLYDMTLSKHERTREFIPSISFEEEFIGCCYYDNIICIVCLNDTLVHQYRNLFFDETDSMINVHLYQEELENISHRYPSFYRKIKKRNKGQAYSAEIQ